MYLPARTTWKIHKTVTLQDYQEIATFGYPTSHEDMAYLDAQEDCNPHVVHAFDKSGIRIRNLVIEGNKEKYGWDEKGGVMIQLGGGKANNQVRCPPVSLFCVPPNIAHIGPRSLRYSKSQTLVLRSGIRGCS